MVELDCGCEVGKESEGVAISIAGYTEKGEPMITHSLVCLECKHDYDIMEMTLDSVDEELAHLTGSTTHIA